MTDKLFIPLVVGAAMTLSVSSLADDNTPAQPIDQQKLKEERVKAKEESRKRQSPALPLKGGFGPAGGRAERGAMKQRQQEEREQSMKAWAQKYGPDDPSKKGTAQ